MNTKIKLEKGSDEMHAFLELMLDGVQNELTQARKAMNINCEEVIPGALGLMRDRSQIVDRIMSLSKKIWSDVERIYETEEIEIEIDARERGEMVLALEEGIKSKLVEILWDARSRKYQKAAFAMQDLGQAMAAASHVLGHMEDAEEEAEEKGGSHE